jgi:hypothetical protein
MWFACSQVIIAWYSANLCFFVADSSFLVDLQLGSLITFLSGIFDLIESTEKKSYNTWGWFWYQACCWWYEDNLGKCTAPGSEIESDMDEEHVWGPIPLGHM